MQQVFLHNTSAQYLDSHTSHITDPNDVVRKFLRRKIRFGLKLERLTMSQTKLEYMSAIHIMKRFKNIKQLQIVFILFSNGENAGPSNIGELLVLLDFPPMLGYYDVFVAEIHQLRIESGIKVIMTITRK